MDEYAEHPVQLDVDDDLRRNRLTVFFRIVLAIPHFIWYSLWTLAVIVVAIINWFATLITGRPPAAFHRFLCAFIRYGAHLGAYLYLVADPYPGFIGEEGEYEVQLRLPPDPQEQPRWKTLLRVVLVIPAALVAAFLGGGLGFSFNFLLRGRSGSRSAKLEGGGFGGGLLAAVCAFFGWFACVALGRMPRGLRDAAAYGVGYNAQVAAYLLLVTDRYPNADPTAMLASLPRPAEHPVHLVGDAHDLRRSRATVFFRLPLLIPHIVWLYLWTIAVLVVAIVNWFATLITGAPPRVFHRFLSAYVRYTLHVYAFGSLAANPFPGFTGAAGTYPLDLVLPEGPQRQARWKTFFRIVLVLPAWIIGAVLTYTVYVVAVLMWFVALFTGAAPWGLRNLSAYGLRFLAQLNAYLYLLTDRYPDPSPLEGEDVPETEPFEPEPLTA